MRNHTLFALLLFTAIVTGSSFADPLGRIHFDTYGFYDTPYIHYNVRNDLDIGLESAKVYVSFPELPWDMYDRSSRAFELDPGDHYAGFLTPDVRYIPPGEYYARVVFSWDGFRDVKYIPVCIGCPGY